MQGAKSNRHVEMNMRESGIELLKIIAIILIVVSHVIQTLRNENQFITYSDYVLDLSTATTDIRNFVLILFSHFGALGNNIFFVCSAWFLLQSSRWNKKKWSYMLLEVWIISIIILILTLILRGGDISTKIIIKSMFPNIFANNWYLTCYLLFYPIHPLLNLLIKQTNKKILFRMSASMFILYCGFGFIKGDLFFPSPIILWITIYLIIAYIQLYMWDFFANIKNNIILLTVGFSGFIGGVALVNILGIHIPILHDKVLNQATNCNPFLIIISIAVFNIMHKCTFKNFTVNYISSLSYLIYIIHENLILKNYFRPIMVNYIYVNYGYKYLVFWVLVMIMIVFFFGLICAIVYDKVLRRFIKSINNSLYPLCKEIYMKSELYLLKFY